MTAQFESTNIKIAGAQLPLNRLFYSVVQGELQDFT